MISSSRWSGAKCGKPLRQHSENGGKQIRPALEDLLRAGRQFGLRPHRQGQQGEQWIEIGLLAQLLQTEPDHAINKRLQLLRQKGWAKLEAPVRHHYDHRELAHSTRVLLGNASVNPRVRGSDPSKAAHRANPLQHNRP